MIPRRSDTKVYPFVDVLDTKAYPFVDVLDTKVYPFVDVLDTKVLMCFFTQSSAQRRSD